MTGIERLRELVDGIDRKVTLYCITTHAFDAKHEDMAHKPAKQILSDIADQIQRERAEDAEAIAWVREHGGLDAVKRHWKGYVPAAWLEEAKSRHEQRRDRLKAHAWELECKCAERRETIEELGKTIDEMRPRLMPEGMEWPRFEDGEPVRVGDEAPFGADGTMTVTGVELTDGGHFILHGRDGGIDRPCQTGYQYGQRVKRPAPKVTDAGGVEIRVGDTVWTTRDLDKFTVTNPNNGNFLSVSCKGEDGEDYCCYPTDLTHRAPVLAADGRPLREGEHVWHVETGTELVVKGLPKPGEHQAVVVFAPPASHLTSFDPNQLTHERSESKCRDCAHWQKDPIADNMGVCWFYYHEHEGQDCYAARRGDIGACEEFMPRGKELAGDA